MRQRHIEITSSYSLVIQGTEAPFTVSHSSLMPVSWQNADATTHAAWKRWAKKHGGPRWVTREAATRACKAFAAHVRKTELAAKGGES